MYMPLCVTAIFLLSFVQAANTLLIASADSLLHSNGLSGEKCGPNGRCRAWPFPSTCGPDNKCRCDDPREEGKGNFMCHYPEEEFCAAMNDPEICRYDGSRVFIPLSCKTIFTHVKGPICEELGDHFTAKPDFGECESIIYIWGQRADGRGKTYISGFQANFRVTYNGVTHYQNYRVYGKATNGEYTYCIDGNQNPGGVGPWLTSGNGINLPMIGAIYEVLDDVNNFASIYADLCGIKVGVRPVDIAHPRNQAPGVYVKVHTGCEPTVVDTHGKIDVCGLPESQGSKFDVAVWLSDLVGRPVSLEVAFMFAVLRSRVPQDFPNAPAGLQPAVSVAEKCNPPIRLVEALERCQAINELRFVRCYEPGDASSEAINLWGACIRAYCDASQVQCEQVQDTIIESNCAHRLEGSFPTILDQDCGQLIEEPAG